MNKTRILLVTLMVLGSGLVGARPAVAAERESVIVTGTGAASGEPDTLAANLGVETTAPTVAEALTSAGVAATRMRDALVRDGIAKADLQTSNVSVSSTVGDDKKVTGYTAVQGLVATVRDLPRAGALISTAMAAGGDAARLNGVTFAIEDQAALLDDARAKAFAEARRKATLYAGQAGRPLGRVIRVSEENSGYQSGAAAHYDLASDSANAAVPIEPGLQQLSVTVTVEWSFQ
ncbi:SIMPL domain-containing protein [Catenuloplanes japonicus]|uniref:SIMPL domain-containing protein n=1 Tax=Catenuloplanes japonicus TaxID=33876 RepID=UPI0005261BF0|nr:SIMPL domain-containing protein [Catenuloplanes japonicus]